MSPSQDQKPIKKKKHGQKETRIVVALMIAMIPIIGAVYWEQNSIKTAQETYVNQKNILPFERLARAIEMGGDYEGANRARLLGYQFYKNDINENVKKDYENFLRDFLYNTDQYLRSGDFSSAIESAEKIEKMGLERNGENDILTITARDELIIINLLKYDYDKARYYISLEEKRSMGVRKIEHELLRSVVGDLQGITDISLRLGSLDLITTSMRADLDIDLSINFMTNRFLILGRFDVANSFADKYYKFIADSEKYANSIRHYDKHLKSSQLNLANAFFAQGNLDLSIVYLKKIFDIKINTSSNIPSITLLANIYIMKGDLAAAEPWVHQAMEFIEHVDTNSILKSGVYELHARYLLAKGQINEAIDFLNLSIGGSRPITSLSITTLYDLVDLLYDIQRYDQAYQQLQRADEYISKKSNKVGVTHSFKHLLLSSKILISLGRFEEAYEKVSKARMMFDRIQGGQYVRAGGMISIAEVLFEIGELDQADILSRAALELLINIPETNVKLRAQLTLIKIKLHHGEFESALNMLNSVHNSLREKIQNMLSFAPENEIDSYTDLFEQEKILLLHLYQIAESYSDKIAYLLFDHALLFKQQSLRTLAYRKRELLLENNENLINLYQRRNQIQRKIDSMYMNANFSESSFKVLNKEKKDLEKILSKSLAEQNAGFMPIPTVENVLKFLPQNATLLEFIEITEENGGRYLAILANRSGSPKIVLLPSTDEIDSAINQWRHGIKNGSSIEKGNHLRELIWDPISEHIDKEFLYIAPDGLLSTISFGSLPTSDKNRFLVEQYIFTYLNTAADLLMKPQQTSKNPPVLLGAPDYNFIDSNNDNLSSLDSERYYSGLRFDPLPGTAEEVWKISQILDKLKLKPQLLESRYATEQTIRELQSPSILHFATHGFFLGTVGHEFPRHRRGSRGFQLLNTSIVHSRPALVIDNRFLMMNSGLALAGANNSNRYNDTNNDGILNAAEVAELDLTGNQLTVVSACQSGIGDILDGRGVYGLRRAFALAGAKNIILTLWSIPDKETKDIMVLFYEQTDFLNAPAKALTTAQRSYIALSRARGELPDPFKWAAFMVTSKTR